ncbi:hypothetical protein EK0264_11680 [Epidermidibacterium keratini]|uniref:Type VII secretion system protein EccE domain-containing protein n=1 Tax=Epidermidibacterium keratini TaxID=1891644 RepID=A0A7L4YP33_9ACTN|nr:type VII secretion protein EccE [Epidermidibacterium keratini]QHC00880.1 hypothetical protein EK0264_11680 [Epidermidibacterium keratini]
MAESQFAQPQAARPPAEAAAPSTTAPAPQPAAAPSVPQAAQPPVTAAAAPPAPAATRAPVDPHVLGGRREATETTGAATGQGRATESSIAKRRAKARAAERETQRAARAGATDRDSELAPTARPEESVDKPIDPPVAAKTWSLGVVGLGQVLTWQLAAVGVLAVHRQPLAILIPVVAVCVVLLVLTTVRVRGRWLYEWAGIWLRYQLRSRTAKETAPNDTILSDTARRTRLSRVDIDGVSAAVVASPHGYSIAIDPIIEERTLLAGRLPQLPSLGDLLPGNDPSEPALSVQQLTMILPAPNSLNRDDAAAQSYAALGASAIPARSRTWVVAQAMVTPDTQGWPEIEATLVNAARRIQRRLTKAGFAPRLVSDQQLARDVTTLVRADVAGDVRALTEERWGHWSAGGALSATYVVARWSAPSSGALTQLLEQLDRLPTMATAIALSARREGPYIDVQAVVRVTDRDPAALDAADRGVRRIADASGVRLQRLDGEHAHGVHATLPTGGFAT